MCSATNKKALYKATEQEAARAVEHEEHAAHTVVEEAAAHAEYAACTNTELAVATARMAAER